MADSDCVYDAIIVGAGISGLQCAASLASNGAVDKSKVLVLEAMESIGGHIQESQTFIPGISISLGADYLHGTDNELYSYACAHGYSFDVMHMWAHGSVARRAGTDVSRGLYYFADSNRLLDTLDEDKQLGQLNDAFNNIINFTESELSSESGGLLGYLSRHVRSAEMQSLARAVLATWLYSDIEDISMKEIFNYCKSLSQVDAAASTLKVEPSLGTIIQSLATGLNIEKNARVTKISYGGRLATDDGMPCPSGDNVSNALVLVETASGLVLRARRVVVATPVAPLLKGELNIEPGLPEMKLKVLSELKLVPKIKIFLKFGVLPWPRNVTGVIMAGCSIPDVTFHEISKAQKAECACYCTGICSAKFADDLKESSEDDLIKLLLEQLDNVFSLLPAASEGSDSLPLPSSVYIGGMVSVWNETIPCLGSFTTRVVDEQQAAILGSPLCDKVFFAGEVTVRGTGLRLHDAMASGLLAADAVAASLSSPRLADALDRYFSQPTATVVGFGSLMAESSARATFPHLKNFRVVRVHGYRRMFGHSPSVMVDRGMATHGSMQQGCLSAEPVYLSAAEENGLVKRLDMSVGFLGVCFDVGMNDLRDAVGGIVGVGGRMWCGEALMKREEEFNFDIVTCQKVSKTGETLDECFPGLMCVASTDEEFKKRWGEIVYAKTLSKTGLNTIWDWGKKSKLKPCSAYANHCYLAAQSLGSHVINSFLDETVLVDRATTIRTYLARNPDVLFYQPPPMHDSRHLTDRVKKTPPRPSKQGVPPELPFPPRLDLPAANAETPAEEIDNKLFTLTTAVTCTLLFGATIYLLYRKRFASK